MAHRLAAHVAHAAGVRSGLKLAAPAKPQCDDLALRDGGDQGPSKSGRPGGARKRAGYVERARGPLAYKEARHPLAYEMRFK